MMTYDMSHKMERRFFQDELMRGRDYLEYIKEILNRGKVAAIKRGCFIGSTPPYGYDKITIGKDRTLVPNKDADIVRMIFNWYVNERIGYEKICGRLNDLGISPVSADKWGKNSVAKILSNVQYDGKVCFYRHKCVTVMKDGKQVASRPMAAEEDIIVVEGKHPAIIDHELFMEAQKIINNHPRAKADRELRNAFAGIAFCSQCGRVLFYNGYGGRRYPRLECRNKPKHFKSVKYSEIEQAILIALEQSELPNLKALAKTNAGNSISVQQAALKRLEDEMQKYREQEEAQYELLETRQYSQELFERRNAALRQKMSACEEKIKKAMLSIPNAVNYEEKITNLKTAIQALKDDTISNEKKNSLLKLIIERIEVTTVDAGRDDTDISLKIFLKI